MSDVVARPQTMCEQRQAGSLLCRHRRKSWLATRFVLALLAVFSLPGIALAQSQPASPPQPQPQKTGTTIADAARKAKSKQDESAPQKTYTNDDVAALPRGGVSIVGLPAAAQGDASARAKAQTRTASAKPADDTAKAAAYWNARFTAARQKLAQDEKSLPVLQSQLEAERVQQTLVDEDTGQVYSDEFMDLLHQIDAMKLTIQKDKQALSDLHDEFRHAGGFPGWIR